MQLDVNDWAEVKATLAVHTERLDSINRQMTDGFSTLGAKLDALATVPARVAKLEETNQADDRRRASRKMTAVKAFVAVLVFVAGAGAAHALGWGP